MELIDALQSENKSLKDVIEVLGIEKRVLHQTVQEAINANINIKTAMQLLEKQNIELSSTIEKTKQELNLLIEEKQKSQESQVGL